MYHQSRRGEGGGGGGGEKVLMYLQEVMIKEKSKFRYDEKFMKTSS